jgi:hypothetical protein
MNLIRERGELLRKQREAEEQQRRDEFFKARLAR